MKTILCSSLILCLTLLTLPSSSKPRTNPQDKSEMTNHQPNIVFEATVETKGEVSFSGVPQSDHTVVVVVDKVIHKPSAITLKQGTRVTVDAIDPNSLGVGSKFVFYTDGWIFGSGIAVHEIRHERVQQEAALASAQERFEQNEKTVSEREMVTQLSKADLVVVGHVASVHPWTPPPGSAASDIKISEHDKNWQEAVIQVETTLKGNATNKEVVVRFPGSWDKGLASMAKLRPGESATFILDKDAVTGAPTALLAGKTVLAHVALRAQDVLPVEEAQHVRSLLSVAAAPHK